MDSMSFFRAIQVEKGVIKYSFITVGSGKGLMMHSENQTRMGRMIFPRRQRCLVLTVTEGQEFMINSAPIPSRANAGGDSGGLF